MRAAFLALFCTALAVLPAEAGREKATPRAQRGFDHKAHAAALRQKTGGTEGCAGACHRSELDGGWVHDKKREHARCFESCHTFATSCGTLAAGAGRVCITCHTNLKERCLPAGAIRTPPGPSTMPARYSHRVHIQPGASGRQCEACHGEFGDRAPRGRGSMAIDHGDCGDCHGRRAEPRMTQCQSCHAAPTARPPARTANPYAVTGAFSHQRHASERRVGTAGRECMTCHANIAQARDDAAMPMPTMRGCLDGCHDGAKAFSAVGATCTRCHKGSGADAPPGGDARFSHDAHGKRGVDVASCSACHSLAADFRVAPPIRGKDHRPCATSGCHADAFLTRGGPLCAVCHEGTAPWVRQEGRSRRPPRSEFGSDFSHRSHLGNGAAGNDQCRKCHGDPGGGEPPAGHQACAPCHGRGTPPDMNRCGGCHAPGSSVKRTAASPWSVAARFRHETHREDPRKGRGQARCAECHAGVAAAARLANVAPPTMKSCSACHNGEHAFKTTGFGCAKCHGQTGEAARPR
jgi:c(7)-type cytochrome triheme protein